MKNWYFILLLAATVGCSSALKSENISVSTLSANDSDVATSQSVYKPRLNFDAKMEPKTGIIYAAG
ncbi:hypothetical protein [Colwellia sp. UCD-KL20]|uniref:hypothetical protein n=1 Tax=Colwellia sp. UCD-KL20 TaxID=1917165 RepID=UPI000970AF3A|nr:hypothetical protein [Colwellia sp. UCD-KL20]